MTWGRLGPLPPPMDLGELPGHQGKGMRRALHKRHVVSKQYSLSAGVAPGTIQQHWERTPAAHLEQAGAERHALKELICSDSTPVRQRTCYLEQLCTSVCGSSHRHIPQGQDG